MMNTLCTDPEMLGEPSLEELFAEPIIRLSGRERERERERDQAANCNKSTETQRLVPNTVDDMLDCRISRRVVENLSDHT